MNRDPIPITIHESAFVHPLTQLEIGVQVAEMACIGVRGMTLKWDDQKHISWRREETNYQVELRKGVYVGARSLIMRGTKWNTVIGEGTFIGPNVSVGHDTVIGKHCLLLSGTITCGSVTIGDYTYIAPGVLIKNGVTLGKNVRVGIGSMVLKDVPDGMTVVGRPAESLEIFNRKRQQLKRIMI